MLKGLKDQPMQSRVKSRRGYYGVKLHQFLSFSPIFAKKTVMGEWAFFPGCSMMGYDPELVMRVYSRLKEFEPSMGIISGCCGHPAFGIDDKSGFERYSAGNAANFKSWGVKKLVVCCPNCAETLKGLEGVSVVSIWSFLEREKYTADLSGNERYVLHDPCPTRRDPETQEAFRWVMARCGVSWEEYPSSRERALCCGKVRMLMVLNPPKGREVLMKRVGESANRNVLTYCFSCADSFRSAGCRSVHGLELLFPGVRKERGTWMNRFKSASFAGRAQ